MGGFFASLIVCGSCFDSKPTEPTKDPRDTVLPADNLTMETAFGTFKIMIEGQKSFVSFLGLMKDGKTPPSEIYSEIMTDGPFKLYKRLSPNCAPECVNAECIADNICQPKPNPQSIGTITVNGLKMEDGTTSFTMDPVGLNMYYISAESPAYPPCGERDLIKLSATGNGNVAAFDMTLKGVTPLKILPNDTAKIPCENGKDVTLKWVPPSKKDGSSKIFFSIDISYHGGTKAKIECECDDDGEQIIPGKMLDSLKSFGISGFPRIEMYRRSSASNPASMTRFVMESYVVLYLNIPGVISCGGGLPACPDGYECGGDQRCKPIASGN
jgi:hypothetical protein